MPPVGRSRERVCGGAAARTFPVRRRAERLPPSRDGCPHQRGMAGGRHQPGTARAAARSRRRLNRGAQRRQRSDLTPDEPGAERPRVPGPAPDPHSARRPGTRGRPPPGPCRAHVVTERPSSRAATDTLRLFQRRSTAFRDTPKIAATSTRSRPVTSAATAHSRKASRAESATDVTRPPPDHSRTTSDPEPRPSRINSTSTGDGIRHGRACGG